MIPEKMDLFDRYIDSNHPAAFRLFTHRLHYFMETALLNGYETLAFLCIGTDRSTGDSLGPLVGYKIKDLGSRKVHVCGTLEDPVHALNLPERTRGIKENLHKPFIIAIDACLGSLEHVGYIMMDTGPLRPGAGVNKKIDPVGDMHINGIVNVYGFLDFFILQNTRLCTVMKMADLISSGIRYVLWKIRNSL